ncbi:hypothetical protein FOC4_g10007550, partial [Fusarium odoratissimum]
AMSHRMVTITFIFATLLLYVFSNDPYLNSRLAHAEKLWKRSIKAREEMAQVVGYDAKFPDGYMNPFNVWDFARPSFFCPHDLERVGSISDGGKIICGMSRYEKECPGPSSDSNKARELIVYSFGMDIEGAEFDALTSLIESVKEQRKNGNATLPFGQLLVEMHLKKAPEGVTVPNDLRSWLKWWYSLEAMGLRPVSNEDNWIGDRVYGMPRFMEYTFINTMDKERNLLLWT